MAKIKTTQQGGTVTVTRAGATKRTFSVSEDGVLTCRKDEVADLLRRLPGSKLVEGTATEEDEPLGDPTANVTEPPNLPPPAPGQPTVPADKDKTKAGQQ